MPGIVGVISGGSPAAARRELQTMIAKLRHEPFYVSGTWIDESLGVYVGWVARKNSFSDRMPICNERGDVVLIFSGEDFPPRETRAQLKQRGEAIKANPASYLAHEYEKDPSFPAGLNGMF